MSNKLLLRISQIYKNTNISIMGKKNKKDIKPQIKLPQFKITSTEIKITSNADLNFKDFKIKKDEEIIISDKVFDKLCVEIPNLGLMRSKGVIQIVK